MLKWLRKTGVWQLCCHLGTRGTALPGMLRAPGTPWAVGRGGEGAKGLLAEPGSFLWVKQEGILSAFAGSGGCLRRTSSLDGRAQGDMFIATGTEAIELG